VDVVLREMINSISYIITLKELNISSEFGLKNRSEFSLQFDIAKPHTSVKTQPSPNLVGHCYLIHPTASI
jgi:hypothetical protein